MSLHQAVALARAPLTWRSVLVLMAATAVAGEWIAPQRLAVYAPAQSVAIDVPRSSSPAAVPPAATYPAIAEHPLFYPTRQPWTPPAVETKAPPTQTGPVPLANYVLVGVVITNANRAALVKSSTNAKTVTLTEGRELKGWTLREITRERLRFESGGAAWDMGFPAAKPGR